MIERVAATDEADGETFLLLGGFERLRAECNGSCGFGGLLFAHDRLIPMGDRVMHFLYREQAPSVNGMDPNPKPETCFPLLTRFPIWPGCVCRCIGPHPDAHNATDDH